MNTSKFYKTLIIFSIAILSQFGLPSNLIAQSITVTVKDQMPLEFTQIDVHVNLTETELDYEAPEYPDLEMPELLSTETLLSELKKAQLQYELVASNSDPKSFYSRETKKQQVETRTISTYLITLKDTEDLTTFKDLIKKWHNLNILDAKFDSKNEEATLRLLTNQLLDQAKLEANILAQAMDKNLGEPTEIKVINMQTKGHSAAAMLYVLEQKAFMELVVTFETN